MKAQNDHIFGPLLAHMTANILTQIDPEKLLRITLDNNIKNNMSIDSMIGRAAHISFLDDIDVVSLLFYNLFQYLK